MDVYDIMLAGRMISYSPKVEAPREYLPGDISLLSKGVTRTYTLDHYTYMIDYGRGNIAFAFNQGVIGPWFNNHDNESLKVQLRECTRSFIDNKVNALSRGLVCIGDKCEAMAKSFEEWITNLHFPDLGFSDTEPSENDALLMPVATSGTETEDTDDKFFDATDGDDPAMWQQDSANIPAAEGDQREL